MTSLEKEKLKKLENVFDMNFKVTRLFAEYLERFPELINDEMIKSLTADGDITEVEAVRAILEEAFALDYGNKNDRRIIKEYLYPSVRIMDPKRYTENKYYKNIKIENVKEDNWELKELAYEPWRAVIANDMIIKDDFTEIPPLGFFPERFTYPAVLEDGNEWMTLTPVDLDTCDEAIERSRGKVLTFGLGLGYYAYMASEKDCVTSVTVVERSPKVIKLFEKYILPQFQNKDKIRIVNEDAFLYAENTMGKENFNFAFVDIWRDASDGSPIYKRMKPLEKLAPNTEFCYWIENFLISRLRALEFVKIFDEIESGSESAPKTYDEVVKRLKKPF